MTGWLLYTSPAPENGLVKKQQTGKDNLGSNMEIGLISELEQEKPIIQA
jgi:hypothetical protein